MGGPFGCTCLEVQGVGVCRLSLPGGLETPSLGLVSPFIVSSLFMSLFFNFGFCPVIVGVSLSKMT